MFTKLIKKIKYAWAELHKCLEEADALTQTKEQMVHRRNITDQSPVAEDQDAFAKELTCCLNGDRHSPLGLG